MIKLYNHGGSLNHGCEAIVRSTKKIIGDNIELWSKNPAFDKCYGLDKVIDIKHDQTSYPNKIKNLYNKVISKILKTDEPFIKQARKVFLDNISQNDICLSIGGDLYCYRGVDKLYYLDKAIKNKKAKTVLWGCSVDVESIDVTAKENLSLFDLIIARETISFNTLKKINKNTYLYPDPAFQLETEKPQKVNEMFEKDMVGINVSPLIIDCEKNEGITKKSYENLIEYILNHTNLKIALIPHVVYDFSDDRKPLIQLYEKYKDSKRVMMIEDCSCSVLKWYISKCRFIITARTHVSIASYSKCVPTLVVGYSTKAKGIAEDIFGTYENYVLPVQSLSSEDTLTNQFIWLMKNEEKIKSHLHSVMPEYCSRSLMAGELVRNMHDW